MALNPVQHDFATSVFLTTERFPNHLVNKPTFSLFLVDTALPFPTPEPITSESIPLLQRYLGTLSPHSLIATSLTKSQRIIAPPERFRSLFIDSLNPFNTPPTPPLIFFFR